MEQCKNVLDVKRPCAKIVFMIIGRSFGAERYSVARCTVVAHLYFRADVMTVYNHRHLFKSFTSH